MSLFIKKYKYPSGKVYCSIVDGFRINGKVKQNVIQKYGYLNDIEDKFGNADEYLNNELIRLKNEMKSTFVLKIDKNVENDFTDDTFNIR